MQENQNNEVENKNEEVSTVEVASNNGRVEELEDRLKRSMAEFENYKKRVSKEKDFLYNSITSDIISGFLPVLDSIEKATTTESDADALKQGLELISKQIQDIMSQNRVEEISTVGKTFDPELHEAVSHIEDHNYGEKEITTEFRKGYKIGTKVIRHAMVVVAN